MGFLTDIRKKLNGTPANGLDGRGAQGATSHVPRGKGVHGAQQPRRPQGLDAGSESQDSGVVIVHKDSQLTLGSVPDYSSCPKCAAVAAAGPARSVHTNPRPSMDVAQPYSSSRPVLTSHAGHIHEQPRVVDAGHDHSRPGTGYSNHSALLPMQSQPHRQHHNPPPQQHDPGFSSRPVSWGRRATTENVAQDVPSGYTRPVTPPYSVTSEQTGWNSGSQYNNISHVPGPASHDGHTTSQRPTSWRRATSSNMNFIPDQRQQGHHYAETAPSSSRAPSEAGSNHPRNASKNMETSAYEAGYRDAIARLRADAERW